MKIVVTVVAAVIVAAGFSLMSAPEAEAGCVPAYGCSAQVLVPTPQPIPLRRRWRQPRVIAAASCVSPSVARPVAVAPAPCVAPCGVLAPRAYYYRNPNYYAYYNQPAYAGGCNLGPGNCYWRRNCWYDSFGRRFCD